MHRKDILWFVLYKLYISVVFFPLSVTVGARDLKLPLQNENPMVDDSGMSNLVTIGKAATLTSASDFKGSLKNMEKSKGNHNGSANPNVRRKALADVTNVAVNIYKNAKHDGSKPMKAKADRSMFLQRPSLGPGARTVNAASRKSFMGTAKVNLCQGAGDMHTSERGIKDTKASSCYQRSQARISSQESFVNIRRTARSSLIPTRKSLPVLKRVNQGDANDSKGCAQNSGEAKEMSNAPVKAKFGKNVAPRVNNGRSHLRRNRASDGFMIMGPTASADACVLSRKSVKAQHPCLADYMSIQTSITPHMRGILINWLIEVHFKFDLMQETLYLMVTLLDQYLSQVNIEKNEMQLVGLTSLLLASKYEDFWHPRSNLTC
ncbi:uncharacterized protein [Elaeis guineensis]|uniref:uncharacterized protein isoform X2 n=1 Tax=Elaeis guineensis var. tenera TaxID=51953 RepID=UPI003C6D4BE2